MCPSAPRVCSEPGGQRLVLSLSLDLIASLQPEILCLTLHTACLIWRVWPRSFKMRIPARQRHRGVEKIEKCTMKTQPCVASTPLVHNSMVIWPHFVSVYDFSAVWLTLFAIMIQIFSLQDDSVNSRWHVHAVQNKNTRVNMHVAIHKIAWYKWF